MENFCCCPEWLSERERLDLPCGSQESVEDIPCCECCWFMPVSEELGGQRKTILTSWLRS